jgi:hypothetical protein
MSLQLFDRLEFEPFNCSECGRPNNPAARICLWCGELLSAKVTGNPFPTTHAELDYLNGIVRLDNPMPVRLAIKADGIEVKEILPGTRIYQIGVEAIIEARVTKRVEKIKIEKKISLLQKFLLDVSADQKRQFTEEFLHDYILTIGYRAGDKICTAAFHREDEAGKSLINNVAKAINSLIKSHAAQGK